MNEKDRIKIVSGIDILVGIFLLIVGILVVIMAVDMINLMASTPSYSYTPTYYNMLPWIFFMLGLGAVIYGIKRIVDDVLKIKVINKQFKPQPPRYQTPVSQTIKEPPKRQF